MDSSDANTSAMESAAPDKIQVIRSETDEEDGREAEKDVDPEVGVERRLLKKGGITKTVVKRGTCTKTPPYGDEVIVHYTGTLPDGTVFDTSRDKEPFTFKLGVGQVIRGWDKGVKTMRRGEQAVFTIQPHYAYGKAGHPPAIPPDTPLHFEIELLSWCTVKDVCRDGGVLKKIFREGLSWETPNDADQVKVKYEVKLEDGTVVSKSPEDGQQFIVEEGWLCPAFKHAVKSMKVEEAVVLTVQPEYGFGIEGREAKDGEGAVPLNATLTVDLALVSWNSVETVTDDKKIIKKVTKKGESYEKPNDGSTVTNGTVFEKKGLYPGDPITVVIDEDQVITGLDETLTTMKKGEVCIVVIPPEYGYGNEAKQCDSVLVPANSTLTYEVEMISFVKAKDSWDLDALQKIAAAAKKKDQGNDLFKQGKLFFAARKYEKGGKYVEYESIFADGEEKRDARALKMSVKLNEAACRLKLDSFPEVVDLTTKVLEIDSVNVKALFRRAQAYCAMMDLELAVHDLKKLLDIDPENRSNCFSKVYYESVGCKVGAEEGEQKAGSPSQNGS